MNEILRQAETMHQDAGLARQALTRLMGYSLPLRELEALKAARESVDVIDRAAVSAIRSLSGNKV